MKYRGPVLLGALILFVGVFVSGSLGWYYFFPHIDKVFHFVGGMALGWFFYIYYFSEQSQFSNFKKLIIIVGSTCLVAVIWEYFERLSSLYSPHYAPWLSHWISGGDLNDTLLDVFTGTIGSFLFVILKLSKK
jgi:hypothetical protein